MATSKSLIDGGRLGVAGQNHLTVEWAYWLVYPPRSLEHRELPTFRAWLPAKAADHGRRTRGPSAANEV
ncbi:MAG: hypothetical protein ABI379_03885 [Rhodanobacter sp.]